MMLKHGAGGRALGRCVTELLGLYRADRLPHHLRAGAEIELLLDVISMRRNRFRVEGSGLGLSFVIGDEPSFIPSGVDRLH